ncbi:MAG TPA: hypothetical protein VMV69_15090 [Pirellulales bacterium]|nr:hypothetical protein [Pirellulales bacterium]
MTTQLDHQRTVEAIQNAVTEVSLPLDLLLAVIADYQTACEEANERLRECQDLLRRGLRGEAIQRCDAAPNLLELVAVLDFPERLLWCDALRQAGRTVPAELRIDAAAELNAAYAQEQPLGAMMGRHRLLALARAPLPQRIAQLRKIARADPANAVWNDDLVTFEKRRHQQLQGEAEAALRAGDLDQIDRLERELCEAEWLQPPRAALVQWTVDAANKLRAQRAQNELATIEPELTAAFSDFDVERGRALRSRWQACATLADLADDDALAALTAPALEWLAEQDQRERAEADYARALAELERALDDSAGREQLDRRYHDLVRCERGVPRVLERRFRERVGIIDLAASRRNKLWIVGIAAAVLAAAGLTWFGIQHQHRENEVAEAAGALSRLIDESKLDEMREFLDGLGAERSWLRARSEVVELEARLDGLVSQERDRAAAFRAAIEAVTADGLDRPDPKLLDEARRLAQGSQEEHEVLQWEHRIAGRRRELQGERDHAFTERVEELRGRVQKLEAGEITAGEELLAAIERIEVDAAQIEQESGAVDHALAAGASALRKKLRALHETEQLRLDHDQRAGEITAAVGQRDRFREKLAVYVKAFPEGKRSHEFLQVLDKEPAVWEQVEKWDLLVGRLAKLDLAKETPAQAAAHLAEAQALLTAFATAPQAAVVRRRMEFLPPIARRVTADGERLEAPLRDMFQLRTIADLTLVEDRDGKRYYTDEAPRRSGHLVTVKYLQNFKLATKSKLLKDDHLAKDGIAAAPQSLVAKKVLDQLSRLDDAHWEGTFCHILVDVVEQPRMDPVLKAQLLGQILAVARQGSLTLEHVFSPHEMLITGANLDGTVNWLDPDDADARRARVQAQELLKRLPDLRAAREAAAKEFNQAHRPENVERFRWIGWLSQSDDGHWRCSTGPLAGDVTGDLYVAHPNANGMTVEFSKLGRLAAGHAALDEASPALLEGRPVYASVAPATTR